MLEEVVGDDEINRFRLDGRQQLTVVDDIDWRQILAFELRIVRPQLRAPSSDPRTGR